MEYDSEEPFQEPAVRKIEKKDVGFKKNGCTKKLFSSLLMKRRLRERQRRPRKKESWKGYISSTLLLTFFTAPDFPLTWGSSRRHIYVRNPRYTSQPPSAGKA